MSGAAITAAIGIVAVTAILQQTSGFDVVLALITAGGALALPFVMAYTGRWLQRENAKVAAALQTNNSRVADTVAETTAAAAEKVSAVAVSAADKVAQTVTDVAAKADAKIAGLTELGEKTHTLVNSQRTELMNANKAQQKEIKRLGEEIKTLLASADRHRRKRPTKRGR